MFGSRPVYSLWDILITAVAAFLVLFALSAYGGLVPNSSLPTTGEPFAQSDKVLHFLTCFALTLTFYFILDTSRRRVLHLTLAVCTLGVGVGSEVVQGLLPNDRKFDVLDVLANIVGSLAALGLATWYHRRSAERRRRAKYSVLGHRLGGEGDLELGEAPGSQGAGENERIQDNSIVAAPKTVEDELDNWDENAEDEAWDEDDDATTGGSAGAKVTPSSSSVGEEDFPKKVTVD
jgi:VanZ family protein